MKKNNNNSNNNNNLLTDSMHIKIPTGLKTQIMTYRNEQRILTESHAIITLIKIGLDVYKTYLTGNYVDPFEIRPMDPRLASFVDNLSKEDKERLFYHMLGKMPGNELKRIRQLAGIVD